MNDKAYSSGINYRVIEQYYSMRNRVLKVSLENNNCSRALLVIKKFPSAKQAEKEYRNLLGLSRAGLKVPRPLALDGPALYMQYLEGLLLTDIIEKEMLPRSVWTEKMARWYAALHLGTTTDKTDKDGALLKTDNNLRNFIYVEEDFYGLDFEEILRGDPASDIGQACAFILTDRPAFTEAKQIAAAELARRYCSLNRAVVPSRIEEEVLIELEKMAERRKEEKHSIRDYINSLSSGSIKLFSP